MGWTVLTMMMGQLPEIGLYINMLFIVAKDMIKVILSYICLIVAFGIAFHIILPEEFSPLLFGMYRYGRLQISLTTFLHTS